MLRAVLDGAAYDAVAALHGVSRTAVERRIKAVATHLASSAGIDGLNQSGAAVCSQAAPAPSRRRPRWTACSPFARSGPWARPS